MSNCLLSIGGAGHRSLKPLVFLAAAGALADDELSMLCVDNDGTNGNLTESLNLIHLYNKVQGKQRWLGDSPFFRPKLQLMDDRPWSPFAANEGEPTLDHYLRHESMRAKEDGLTALYEFLYDRDKRSLSVTEGFRGKPSIGAAVYRAAARGERSGPLDSLQRLRQQLENGVAQGRPVKLFSMGSIFGGTGAAGLPTLPVSLIESMRQGGEHVLSGGAFLLPYFEFNASGLEAQGPHAKPSDFIMMMKDALRYYQLNPSRYQCVYAIGSDRWRHLENPAVGKKEQKNQADLVEFLAALAASNFLVSWQPSDPAQSATPQNGQPPELYVLHREGDLEFHWTDIPERERIKPKLAAFSRFCFLYLSEFVPLLERSAQGPVPHVWFTRHVQQAGANHTSTEFQEQVANLKEFCQAFLQWWEHLHNGSGLPLKLMQVNAFSGGHFDCDAFETFVLGERFGLTRDQAVRRMATFGSESKPELNSLGHFAVALARVTQ